VETVFGGAANVEFMKTAPTVRACRLHRKKDARLRSHEYDAEPFVKVSPDQARRFQEILQNPGTYVFDAAKACLPNYGVRLQFAADDKTVDVEFCFECNILLVLQDGKPVGGEDFDHARAPLVALCKELLPDDAEIQALQPDR